MDRYINANIFRKSLIDRQITDCFFNHERRDEIGIIIDLLDKQPTADVVESKQIEQIKWERDTAIKQLESYGVGFGEKADVVRVKHGEWELKSEIHTWFDDVDEEFYVECPFCHRTEWIPFEFEEEKMLEYARKHFPYCHCGAKMDGERSSTE